MIAVLHYAILKSVRDRSLAIFLFGPAIVITASLLGVSLRDGSLHYPLHMTAEWSPAKSAEVAGIMTTVIAVIFASVASFWTFRSEVATKSIGSFVMARRPISVALALVVFAAVTGFGGWVGGMAAVGALTAAFPAKLASLALAIAIVLLAAASLGALMVTISTEPPSIIGVYCAVMLLLPWLTKAEYRSPLLIVALVLSMLCTVVCAFLLERRCAS
jgi:hypothetical protein